MNEANISKYVKKSRRLKVIPTIRLKPLVLNYELTQSP